MKYIIVLVVLAASNTAFRPQKIAATPPISVKVDSLQFYRTNTLLNYDLIKTHIKNRK